MGFEERMEQRMKIKAEARYDMMHDAMTKILLFAENTAGSKIDIHMTFGDEYDADVFDVTIEHHSEKTHTSDKEVTINYDLDKRV